MVEADNDLYLSEVDSPVKPKLKSAVVKIVTTGSTKPAVKDLFPEPPTRRGTRLAEFDLFARKRSSRGKHSSNHRRENPPTNSANHRRENTATDLRRAINKAKDRQRQQPPPRRIAEIVAPNQPPNRPRVQRAQPQSHSSANSTSTANTTSATRTVFRIPRVKVDVATQTDLSGPCRCVLRNKVKNQNRRAAFKLNRDLVEKFKLTEL